MNANAPKIPSQDGVALLRYLHEELWRGCGARPPDTPARRELKRMKLIESKPPNYISSARTIAGHARRWLPTPAGRALLEYLDS